jgi:hypothetical protein
MKKSQSVSISKKLPSIELPKPTLDGGKTVLRSLLQRKTIREISDKKLPRRMLSTLLWAACGVNRKKGPFGIPGRTSATASNSQEIDCYVAAEDGIYLYNALMNKLEPVATGDFRALTIGRGQPDFAATAPIHLIYVADVEKLFNTSGFKEPGLRDPEVQKAYYYVDTGLIAGNVYLFAASQGLASWFHNCDKTALNALLKLRAHQGILFAQTIGYPRNARRVP